MPTPFTPTVNFANMGDAAFSYASQTGLWSKSGEIVCFVASVGFTPTYTTASGALRITLPYPVTALFGFEVVFWGSNMIVPGGTLQGVGYSVLPNMAALRALVSNGAPLDFTTAQFLSGTAYNVSISGAYF